MRTESDTPFLATPADLLASRLRQIAMRMQFRIEAIAERGGETVGLSLGFAGEIERACREAAEWVAPPVPLPSNKYMGEEDESAF